MNHYGKTRRSQKGSVLVLAPIAMVVLIGITGLALDMGHGYLLKTRLQNALDAAALSGAKTLDTTRDPALAEIDALNTFALNVDDDLNDPGLVATIEFSDTLVPFIPGGLDPLYVRARLDTLPCTMWFAHVLPGVGNSMNVAATAVAGPSPTLGVICDIAPIMVCGDPDADNDCSDGSCYGYTYDPASTTEIVLKTGAQSGWEVGPGNYQLISLDGSKGGADIRENLAGSYENCLKTDEDVETEPGNKVGPVAQGLNTRFGIYNGPFSAEDEDIYKPDLVSNTQAPDSYFSDYLYQYGMGGSGYDHPDGEAERRVVAVPLGDCTGTTNGSGTVELIGIGCFFLTQPAEQGGDQRVYGQFVAGCHARGIAGPEPVTGPGPYVIQLYKDPDSGDA
jgi:hypothetical protein